MREVYVTDMRISQNNWLAEIAFANGSDPFAMTRNSRGADYQNNSRLHRTKTGFQKRRKSSTLPIDFPNDISS